ncbi:hemerythrin family protein [Malaciobacter sp. WC5094]
MLIDKNNLPLVAEDFMNDVHFEDVDIINELYEKAVVYKNTKKDEDGKDLIACYEKWYDHTVNHFKGEEAKMLELRFPPYMMHKGEHDRCLENMAYILNSFINSDDIDSLISYLEGDLLSWLVNHIQTMDTVTANFFKTGMSPCSAMH